VQSITCILVAERVRWRQVRSNNFISSVSYWHERNYVSHLLTGTPGKLWGRGGNKELKAMEICEKQKKSLHIELVSVQQQC